MFNWQETYSRQRAAILRRFMNVVLPFGIEIPGFFDVYKNDVFEVKKKTTKLSDQKRDQKLVKKRDKKKESTAPGSRFPAESCVSAAA